MNIKAFDLMINSALKGSSVKALENTLNTFCRKLEESDAAIRKEAYPLIDETLCKLWVLAFRKNVPIEDVLEFKRLNETYKPAQQLYEHITELVFKYGLLANNTTMPGNFYKALLADLLKNRIVKQEIKKNPCSPFNTLKGLFRIQFPKLKSINALNDEIARAFTITQEDILHTSSMQEREAACRAVFFTEKDLLTHKGLIQNVLIPRNIRLLPGLDKILLEVANFAEKEYKAYDRATLYRAYAQDSSNTWILENIITTGRPDTFLEQDFRDAPNSISTMIIQDRFPAIFMDCNDIRTKKTTDITLASEAIISFVSGFLRGKDLTPFDIPQDLKDAAKVKSNVYLHSVLERIENVLEQIEKNGWYIEYMVEKIKKEAYAKISVLDSTMADHYFENQYIQNDNTVFISGRKEAVFAKAAKDSGMLDAYEDSKSKGKLFLGNMFEEIEKNVSELTNEVKLSVESEIDDGWNITF